MKKVSKKNLIQRINRKLKKKHLKLKTNTSKKLKKDLGRYYVVDTNGNTVIQGHVDLETLGRKEGVLKKDETLAQAQRPSGGQKKDRGSQKKERREKMEIKKENLRGLYIGDKLACTDCISDKDLEEPEQILTVDEVEKKTEEGTFIFCDQCKKRIKA